MDDKTTLNVLKGLIIDGVNAAQSGHPGGPLSSIDFAYLLFTEFLKFDPKDPKWMGRDRFILSAGHESMLLYSFLNFCDWLDVSELKRFRRLHSKTPGHPENTVTPGVECTTGPLGQGAAMSVGFAIAGLHCQAALDAKLFDYNIYALLGDGCMQEDITLGAASLAGHLQLNNLIWFYDKNRIQISGRIDRATSDDEQAIFKGFGWDVIQIDGHNHQEIRKTLATLNQNPRRKPTLIVGTTVIGKGTFSMEGDHKTHGAPLPEKERLATKTKLGLPEGEDFYRPVEAVKHFQRNFSQKSEQVKNWQELFATKSRNDKAFAEKFAHYFKTQDYSFLKKVEWNKDKPIASRVAFGDVLTSWADDLKNLMGGSADLEPSNMTEAFAKKVRDFSREDRQGRNVAFGVREFPMSAICNGMALHGGIIPFDATFLSFSDYSRAALRLGAIQKVRVIHEFTHDSFYLGEDGPTHQAIEHTMSLRLIPDMHVMRPADAYETQLMMRKALEYQGQSVICLSRQNLPHLKAEESVLQQANKGAYILAKAKSPEFVIFATGSEVSLALEVRDILGAEKVSVVSMPCWELFKQQSKNYQDEVLQWQVKKRISIEAGVTLGWQKFTGHDGLNIGVDHFGDSAPFKDLAVAYGFTGPAVVEKVKGHKWIL